jgi:hypothetical protein
VTHMYLGHLLPGRKRKVLCTATNKTIIEGRNQNAIYQKVGLKLLISPK